MRHLVTFILRLWVDHENESACAGEVECVATGEHRHIRSQIEAAAFIQEQLWSSPPAKITEDGKKYPEVD
jgi:hypothetical protein